MLFALASAAAILLFVPVISGRFSRRIHPADWTRWSFASVVAGGIAIEVALVLFSLPTVLCTFGAYALVNACASMTGSLMPGGRVVGWSVAVLAMVVAVAFSLGMRKVRKANRTVEACLSSLRPTVVCGHEVITTNFDDPIALTVRGSRPVIVVSSAMRDSLSEDQFHAVVRHEAAHLSHRHDLYLAVLCGIDSALRMVPFVRRSTNAVRCGIERWADADAAASTPGGRSTVREALLAIVFAPYPEGLAAFGAVETIAARVTALQNPIELSTTRRHALAFGLSVALVVATLAAAVGGNNLWHVLNIPAFCELTLQL